MSWLDILRELIKIIKNIIDFIKRFWFFGALTLKTVAYKKRAWEIRFYEFIDCLNGFGQLISVIVRNNEVLGVLPIFQKISGNWLTDFARFSYDSYKRQRIGYPYLKVWNNFVNELLLVGWDYILNIILPFFGFEFSSVYEFVTGKFVDFYTQLLLKYFILFYGFVNNFKFCFFDFYDFRNIYILSLNWYKFTDLLVLNCSEYKSEWPLLNTTIKKYVLNDNLNVLLMGWLFDFGINSEYYGNSTEYFKFSIIGKSVISSLVSLSYLTRFFSDVGTVFSKNLSIYILSKYLYNLVNKFSILVNVNILCLDIADAGANDLGFIVVYEEELDELGLNRFLYLVDNDEIDGIIGLYNYGIYTSIFYQGHHFDFNALKADLILPSALPIEKNSIFGSLYGFYKRLKLVVTPIINNVRVDYKILDTLVQTIKNKWHYFSLVTDFTVELLIGFVVIFFGVNELINMFIMIFIFYISIEIYLTVNVNYQNYKTKINVFLNFSKNIFKFLLKTFREYKWLK